MLSKDYKEVLKNKEKPKEIKPVTDKEVIKKDLQVSELYKTVCK